MTRAAYHDVLDDLGLLGKLAQYEPTVIGTPPLGIDIETSDIDIACTATDLEQFKADVTRLFGGAQAFSVKDLQRFPDAAVRLSFIERDWEIELFCQKIPIAEQWGVRHFLVEQRLLCLNPGLRGQVIKLKQTGLKTEPAFAALLDLAGEPYEALLELEKLSDAELAALID